MACPMGIEGIKKYWDMSSAIELRSLVLVVDKHQDFVVKLIV